MRAALNSAGKTPEDVDYICAYGPGHPALDIVETDMIKTRVLASERIAFR